LSNRRILSSHQVQEKTEIPACLKVFQRYFIRMNKFFRFTLPVFALAALLWLLRTPDTDVSEMTAKYATAPSQFAENDGGLRVHYRDQGKNQKHAKVFFHTWGGKNDAPHNRIGAPKPSSLRGASSITDHQNLTVRRGVVAAGHPETVASASCDRD